jgi:zinc transporter ZupT
MPAELQTVLLLGLLNPAALLVGYWMGRQIDQVQKVLVAGFAAGAAGVVLVVVMQAFGFESAKHRSPGGLFVVCFLAGMLWAYVGYRVRRIERGP